jgi:hypothetical protein
VSDDNVVNPRTGGVRLFNKLISGGPRLVNISGRFTRGTIATTRTLRARSGKSWSDKSQNRGQGLSNPVSEKDLRQIPNKLRVELDRNGPTRLLSKSKRRS